MARRKKEIQNIFSLSFIDVFANTLGALAFILIIVIFMIGIQFAIPLINTEKLPDAYHNIQYNMWLSARNGGGEYNWSVKDGKLPKGLKIDSKTGHIYGLPY
jgi:hypothetical protein